MGFFFATHLKLNTPGFVTAAMLAGISETRIAEHTGHRDLNVMRRYYRNGMVFKGNPAKEIGL